jgi:hypothetical protein
VRLYHQTSRKANHARPFMFLPNEKPASGDAKANRNPCWIANYPKQLAIGKHEAN